MIRLSQIEKKAHSMGIKDTWKLSKTDLIKKIQEKEGNFACFGSARGCCDQLACSWRSDCIK